MKKRIVAGLLSVVLAASVLSGCTFNPNDYISNNQDDEDEDKEDEDEKENKENKDNSEATDSENVTSTGSDNDISDSSKIQIGIFNLDDSKYDYYINNQVAYYSSPVFEMDDEDKNRYPELYNSLSELGSDLTSNAQEQFDRFVEAQNSAIDADKYDDVKYFINRALIHRADSNVVSIMVYTECYEDIFYGPAGSFAGYTYDSSSGDKLSFFDVVSDYAAFREALESELDEFYPDLHYEDEIDNVFSYTEYLNWTVDSNGFTMYFNANNLEYDYPEVVVTVPYEGNENAFNDKYFLSEDEDYTVKLHNNIPTYTDLGNDGDLNKIVYSGSMYGAENNYYSENAYLFNSGFNGFTLSVDGKTMNIPCFAYSSDIYYVHCDGKDYIYAFLNAEEGYPVFVFDIVENRISEKSEIDNIYPGLYSNPWDSYEYVNPTWQMVDPREVRVGGVSKWFSYFNGEGKMAINAEGEFVFIDGYLYNTIDYSGLTDNQLDTKTYVYEYNVDCGLAIEIVDDAGEYTGEWYLLSEGDKLIYYRTDMNHNVDFMLPDGRIGRWWVSDMNTITDAIVYPSDCFTNIENYMY